MSGESETDPVTLREQPYDHENTSYAIFSFPEFCAGYQGVTGYLPAAYSTLCITIHHEVYHIVITPFIFFTKILKEEGENRKKARKKPAPISGSGFSILTGHGRTIYWGERWDLNPRPPGPQPGATTS